MDMHFPLARTDSTPVKVLTSQSHIHKKLCLRKTEPLKENKKIPHPWTGTRD
jgi:hypothetical protein